MDFSEIDTYERQKVLSLSIASHPNYLYSGLSDLPDLIAKELHPPTPLPVIHNSKAQILKSSTEVAQYFHQAGGQLVITGDPGAGKTTFLLQLAQALASEAQTDDALPIPVMLNLSDWAKSGYKPFAEWVVQSLPVRQEIAEAWLKIGKVVLLLDDLDQVPAKYQDACIHTINQFIADSSTSASIAVTTCIFDSLARRLNIDNSLQLSPLTWPQVEAYLNHLHHSVDGLQEAMGKNHALKTLATNPMLLNLMVLAYYGKESNEILHLKQGHDRRTQIFDSFIARRFATSPLSRRPCSQKEMLHSVGWLAWQMQQRGIYSVDIVQDIDSDWLSGNKKKRDGNRVARLYILLCIVILFSVAAIVGKDLFIVFIALLLFFPLMTAAEARDEDAYRKTLPNSAESAAQSRVTFLKWLMITVFSGMLVGVINSLQQGFSLIGQALGIGLLFGVFYVMYYFPRILNPVSTRRPSDRSYFESEIWLVQALLNKGNTSSEVTDFFNYATNNLHFLANLRGQSYFVHRMLQDHFMRIYLQAKSEIE